MMPKLLAILHTISIWRNLHISGSKQGAANNKIWFSKINQMLSYTTELHWLTYFVQLMPCQRFIERCTIASQQQSTPRWCVSDLDRTEETESHPRGKFCHNPYGPKWVKESRCTPYYICHFEVASKLRSLWFGAKNQMYMSCNKCFSTGNCISTISFWKFWVHRLKFDLPCIGVSQVVWWIWWIKENWLWMWLSWI